MCTLAITPKCGSGLSHFDYLAGEEGLKHALGVGLSMPPLPPPIFLLKYSHPEGEDAARSLAAVGPRQVLGAMELLKPSNSMSTGEGQQLLSTPSQHYGSVEITPVYTRQCCLWHSSVSPHYNRSPHFPPESLYLEMPGIGLGAFCRPSRCLATCFTGRAQVPNRKMY